METPALLKMKNRDVGALLIFCLVGFLVCCVVPDPTWAVYSSALIAYHCFFGWLIFMGEERARRTLPIPATIAMHVLFVILVVVLVSSRSHVPRFALLPIPLTAFAIWILSCAVGREPEEREPAPPSRLPSYDGLRDRDGLRERDRLRERRPAKTPSRRRPLIGALPPVFENLNARPGLPASQTPATGTLAPIHQAANSVPLPIAAAAPPPAAASPQPQPTTNPLPTAADLSTKNGLTQNGSVRNGSATNGHLPAAITSVTGLQPSEQAENSAPVFMRDTSIAESIRQRHSDDLTRLNPILGATAEDHEAWLKERGTRNPTHRKLGITVREEYEQWLIARALARNGPPAPSEKESDAPAVSSPHIASASGHSAA